MINNYEKDNMKNYLKLWAKKNATMGGL